MVRVETLLNIITHIYFLCEHFKVVVKCAAYDLFKKLSDNYFFLTLYNKHSKYNYIGRHEISQDYNNNKIPGICYINSTSCHYYIWSGTHRRNPFWMPLSIFHIREVREIHQAVFIRWGPSASTSKETDPMSPIKPSSLPMESQQTQAQFHRRSLPHTTQASPHTPSEWLTKSTKQRWEISHPSRNRFLFTYRRKQFIKLYENPF